MVRDLEDEVHDNEDLILNCWIKASTNCIVHTIDLLLYTDNFFGFYHEFWLKFASRNRPPKRDVIAHVQ